MRLEISEKFGRPRQGDSVAIPDIHAETDRPKAWITRTVTVFESMASVRLLSLRRDEMDRVRDRS